MIIRQKLVNFVPNMQSQQKSVAFSTIATNDNNG